MVGRLEGLRLRFRLGQPSTAPSSDSAGVSVGGSGSHRMGLSSGAGS